MAEQRPRAPEPKVAFSDVRTTIIIPHTFDRNLQVLSVQEDQGKNDLIKEAIREYIVRRGLNPEALPRISISYD